MMVRRCLDTSTPFGIVLIREGSEVAPATGIERELSIAGVGTFAEIREASRFPDGRWSLLVVGGGRFLVRDVDGDREPYLVAEVEPLGDEIGRPRVARALVQRVTRRFVDYLRLLQPRDGEDVEPIDVQVEVDVPDRDDAAAGEGSPAVGPGPGPRPGAGRADDREAARGLAAALRSRDDLRRCRSCSRASSRSADRASAARGGDREQRLRELDALLTRAAAAASLGVLPGPAKLPTANDRPARPRLRGGPPRSPAVAWPPAAERRPLTAVPHRQAGSPAAPGGASRRAATSDGGHHAGLIAAAMERRNARADSIGTRPRPRSAGASSCARQLTPAAEQETNRLATASPATADRTGPESSAASRRVRPVRSTRHHQRLDGAMWARTRTWPSPRAQRCGRPGPGGRHDEERRERPPRRGPMKYGRAGQWWRRVDRVLSTATDWRRRTHLRPGRRHEGVPPRRLSPPPATCIGGHRFRRGEP